MDYFLFCCYETFLENKKQGFCITILILVYSVAMVISWKVFPKLFLILCLPLFPLCIPLIFSVIIPSISQSQQKKYGEVFWEYSELNKKDKKFIRRCVSFLALHDEDIKLLREAPIETLKYYWETPSFMLSLVNRANNYRRFKRRRNNKKLQK
ncbi:hypothetical protein [Candidatus Uabimicrobium sp. HlEnr_7]|uniref:hypothetical protein n=1 Tax=Candidatus Uabimicrobium helgolandensis TaxID=3095367 RepID=UPI0035585A4A